VPNFQDSGHYVFPVFVSSNFPFRKQFALGAKPGFYGYGQKTGYGMNEELTE